MIRIGSLFSGAGGLDLAAEAAFGGETVWHCELDSAASKVLAARWPGIPNLGDITVVDWTVVEPVDVLCGGFPCQDVSAAGRRAGMSVGTRSGLWAVYADAIAALRPLIVVIENVRGLLSAEANRAVESADATVGDGPGRPVLRAAGAVLGDLADLGYDAQWATVSAADVGAPHRRERVFIVATDTKNRIEQGITKSDDTAALERAIVGTGDRDSAGDTAARIRQLGRDTRQQWPVADTARDGRDEGRTESTRLKRGSDAAVGGDGPVELLPTPRATRGGSSTETVELLPTPSVADSTGGHLTRGGARSGEKLLPGIVRELLPTPASVDGDRGPDFARASRDGSGGDDLVTICARATRQLDCQWGKYDAAIRHWEQLTRTAPSPTEPNTKGNPRLSPSFSEWMMGWPAGWVTSIDGINRNDQLRIIGNGVVPQQATAALRWLLQVAEVAA